MITHHRCGHFEAAGVRVQRVIRKTHIIIISVILPIIDHRFGEELYGGQSEGVQLPSTITHTLVAIQQRKCVKPRQYSTQ